MNWMPKVLSPLCVIAAASSCISYPLLQPPTMYNKHGEEVAIHVSPLNTKRASARYSHKTGNYYVIFNPTEMRRIPVEAQLFVYMHEQVHLEEELHLGFDFDGNEMFRDEKLKMRHEKEADCEAVKKLKEKYLFTERQFKIIEDYYKIYIRDEDHQEALRLCIDERFDEWADNVYRRDKKK